MKLMLRIAQVLVVLALTTGFAEASVIYDFAGTGGAISNPFVTLPPQPVAFKLTVADFIDPPLNIPPSFPVFVTFSCGQLDSSTNCGSAFSQAIVFSNQGPSQFSALLDFTSNNNVSYAFDFPTAAFRTPGTYTNSPSPNTGTLTVTLVPEPFIVLLLLAGISFGVLLCGNHFRARIKFGDTKLAAKTRGF